MTLQLHFTFFPVQEFVSESRRTQDLWSSSYLLSYLAARAVDGAIKAGAPLKDFFPRLVGNPLMEAVRGGAAGQDLTFGSLPNRFSVDVPNEATGQKWGEAAAKELQQAWECIAEASWDWVIEQHHPFKSTKHIWDRQVEGQWGVNWVVSGDHSALTERKVLRSFAPGREPGEKCTMCGRRQILSPENTNSRSFWEGALKGRLGTRFIVREGDRLCGVCLTKRSFPRTSQHSIGWKVATDFISTSTIAADPWKREIMAKPEHGGAIENFLSRVRKTEFHQLEGSYFYKAYHGEIARNDDEVSVLEKALNGLTYAVGSAPRNTYAILSMDGDRLGARLSNLTDPKHRQRLSEGILKFSQGVKDIVEGDGRTAARLVYAGGEDVLALLPMDTALETAWTLRESYTAVFRELADETVESFTVSAGLLYCPMDLPLRTAIRQAHRLEDVAKDGAKRDALALAVWKGGGEILSVARKWDDKNWVTRLRGIAREPAQYPSRFLYQAVRLLQALDLTHPNPARDLDDDAVRKLLAVEYYGSKEERFKTPTVEAAEEQIEPLLEIACEQDRWNPDVLRLVRFFFEGAA